MLYHNLFTIILSYSLLEAKPLRTEEDERIKRIVGGTRADNRDWPFIVANTYGPFPNCGGTLISRQWVLSAAHCTRRLKIHQDVKWNSGVVIFPKFTKLQLKNVINNNLLKKYQLDGNQYRFAVPIHSIIPAERMYLHEHFSTRELHGRTSIINDIVLIKLIRPVDLEYGIQFPVLATQRPPVGANCYTAGWGDKYYNRKMMNKTFYILNIKLVSEEQFENRFPYRDSYTRYEKEFDRLNKLYTGTETGHGSIFLGDSGAPLICDGLIYGVAHSVWIDEDEFAYSIFTRVDPYFDWIENKIMTNGKKSFIEKQYTILFTVIIFKFFVCI